MAEFTVPPKIAAIIEHLHTQDNRITSKPLFAVQQKRTVAGLDEDYADKFAWICDGSEVDSEESARLDSLREADEPIPDDCRRVGYVEKWEFVTGCLTEQGCKDFIACNGHNLNEPRIYAYSGYRNAEFIAVREWLMSLRDSGAAPSVAPSYQEVIAAALEALEDNDNHAATVILKTAAARGVPVGRDQSVAQQPPMTGRAEP